MIRNDAIRNDAIRNDAIVPYGITCHKMIEMKYYIKN